MHNTDESSLDTFRRLIEKALGYDLEFKTLYFSESLFRTKQLLQMKVNGGHEERDAARLDQPPIVFVYGARFYILDGQKRINDWTDSKNKGPHRCLIVRPGTA